MTHPHSLYEERRIREKALDETLAGTSVDAVSTTNDLRPRSLRTPTAEARPAGQIGGAEMVDAGLVGGDARITVRRESPDDVGFREIFLSIDGERVAILLPNGTFTVEVKPGPHRLRAHNTLFWKTHDLVLRPDEHARFVAINKAGFGTLAFMMFLGASPLYLTFERDK